jgi:hypothetical protein
MMLTRGFSPSLRGLRGGNSSSCRTRSTASHRAVGALPLILVDGARQEALDIRAFGRHAAADHLGDRAGDHDRRQDPDRASCARFIAPSVPCWPEFLLGRGR